MDTPRRRSRHVRMKTLQYIENLLGGVACSILSVFSSMLSNGDHCHPDKVKQVLCVKFWGIGSLILATPMFEAAKLTFPNAKIKLLTLSGNRGVVKMLPGIDEVQYLDLGSNIFEAISAYLRCVWGVRKQAPDVLIDMEFYTRASAILTFFSRALIRIGYHSQGVWRGNFHSHRIPFNVYRHVTANFHNLLEPFSVQAVADALKPSVVLAEEAADEVDNLIKQLQVNERIFVVNVNAGELAYERRWAPERFAELVRELCDRHNMTALFVGSPSERDYVETVITQVKPQRGGVHNVAGELSLDGLGELFGRSAFVITNDSGPLHLAVAVGARVAAFFGPETPVLYGPVGQEHVVLFADNPCAPCINVERAKSLQCWQPFIRCQAEISVTTALSRIESEFADLF